MSQLHLKNSYLPVKPHLQCPVFGDCVAGCPGLSQPPCRPPKERRQGWAQRTCYPAFPVRRDQRPSPLLFPHLTLSVVLGAINPDTAVILTCQRRKPRLRAVKGLGQDRTTGKWRAGIQTQAAWLGAQAQSCDSLMSPRKMPRSSLCLDTRLQLLPRGVQRGAR